jgi:antitoxin component YwqK of YwqJK toxin-antitoxin module
MKKALILLVFGFPFVSLVLAGVKTDLQKEGLIGPVQTVRTETAQFSHHSGQWIEGPCGQPSSVTYDRYGNLIEGGYAAKIFHTYDAQGNRLETIFYGPDGALLDKTRYTYDGRGNLTEAVSESSNYINRTVYTYDDQGKLIGETVYDPGGNIAVESMHIYDSQGRRVQTINHDPAHDPGLGIEKVVTTYDPRGNIKELTSYYTRRPGDEEERPVPLPNKWVYAYEFDAHGNWVKQTKTSCSAETGKLVCESSLVTYRTITYYPESSTQEP